MTIQMKMAHFADVHYAGWSLPEVDKCFTFAVDHAIKTGVDVAIVPGDATDEMLDLHSPAAIALTKQIWRLSEHCPVLLLQGTFSHDLPGMLSIFRFIGAKHPVFVADSIGQVVLTHEKKWVKSSGWRFDKLPDGTACLFSCIPTVNKGAVAAVVGAELAAEAVGDEIAKLLHGFAGINCKARAAGIPTVALAHGTVVGCITELGVPMAGLDHEFSVSSLFSAEASAVMLGHIHKHQEWLQDGRRIAYSGSVGRLHYGELDAKGFLLWDVAAESAVTDFIPTPARKMIHIDFPGAPDLEQLKAIAADVEGSFVRVRWQIDEENRDSVDRKAIAAIFNNAAEVKLEGRILPIVRSRAEGINQAMTLESKLTKWAETTNTPLNGLAERLQLLATKAPEDIVRDILSENIQSNLSGQSFPQGHDAPAEIEEAAS